MLKVKYNCIQALKETGTPVIIVAAVHEAEAIAYACRDFGIEVSAICDSEKRNIKKRNYCGLEVIHTPTLPERFSKARFIIATQQIIDVVDQLSSLGYDEFYSALELLENYDFRKHHYRISEEYMEKRILVYKKSHTAYFDEEKTYMRSLDVMVTTKCSLKCESCSNLMQYYIDPKNVGKDQILSALNIINENVNEIAEFRIIGGEPLMNKEWADIVNGIVEKNPDSEMFIYTNATIAPKEEQLENFHGKKVNFVISTYGKLSRNLDKLTERLTNQGIPYSANPADNWLDCSSIRHHKRTDSDNQEVFKQCCVKYVYTLLNGKLYRCPFIANAANLNAIPDNPENYVDLFSNTKNIKKHIRRMVKMRKFFPGCDFCDGRPYDPSSDVGYDGKGMIKSGIQTPKILPYHQYV